MSRAFTDWNVDHAVLFPATARDYVPEELDLPPIFESYRDGAGAPAFLPAMMTALLLYGYSDAVRSSRKPARFAERWPRYANEVTIEADAA